MSLTKDDILTKIRAMREGFYSQSAQKIEQRISGQGEEDLTYSKLRAAQDGQLIAHLQQQIENINSQASELNGKINEITQSRTSALLDVESEDFQKNLSPQQKQRVALLKREREDLQYFYQRSQLVNVLETENQRLTKQLHEMQVQLSQKGIVQPTITQDDSEELKKAKETIEQQAKKIAELEEQVKQLKQNENKTSEVARSKSESKPDEEQRHRKKKESSGDAQPAQPTGEAPAEGGERRRRKKPEGQE